MDFVPLIIQIIVAAVVLAPVLWIVGKWFVGKEKAKFTDAVWIGVLGVVIGELSASSSPAYLALFWGRLL